MLLLPSALILSLAAPSHLDLLSLTHCFGSFSYLCSPVWPVRDVGRETQESLPLCLLPSGPTSLDTRILPDPGVWFSQTEGRLCVSYQSPSGSHARREGFISYALF